MPVTQVPGRSQGQFSQILPQLLAQLLAEQFREKSSIRVEERSRRLAEEAGARTSARQFALDELKRRRETTGKAEEAGIARLRREFMFGTGLPEDPDERARVLFSKLHGGQPSPTGLTQEEFANLIQDPPKSMTELNDAVGEHLFRTDPKFRENIIASTQFQQEFRGLGEKGTPTLEQVRDLAAKAGDQKTFIRIEEALVKRDDVHQRRRETLSNYAISLKNALLSKFDQLASDFEVKGLAGTPVSIRKNLENRALLLDQQFEVLQKMEGELGLPVSPNPVIKTGILRRDPTTGELSLGTMDVTPQSRSPKDLLKPFRMEEELKKRGVPLSPEKLEELRGIIKEFLRQEGK